MRSLCWCSAGRNRACKAESWAAAAARRYVDVWRAGNTLMGCEGVLIGGNVIRAVKAVRRRCSSEV